MKFYRILYLLVLSSTLHSKRPCDALSLRALDKITATTSSLYLKTGEVVTFGPLIITLHTCWVNDPEDPFETIAFLDIKEKKISRIVSLFEGWMFASQPALSALEHPVYDIWVDRGFEESEKKDKEIIEPPA